MSVRIHVPEGAENSRDHRLKSTVATVDGLNASEPSGSNLLSMTTSLDAISEVKVLRDNYAAEYGNNGGAMINIVTKGGTKEYTGTAYYFIRNEALNANNFFSNKAGLKRPIYRFDYWGFNFGGPMPLPRFGEGGRSLTKGKAYFFFNMEKPYSGLDSTGSAYVINVGCFTNPTALGQVGSMPRNPVRIPSIFNNDLAFFKNFPIGEKRALQLRWDIYNIFNHPNFDDIDGTLTFGLVSVTNPDGTKGAVVRQTRSSFGTPMTARTPRVMQASIRLNF